MFKFKLVVIALLVSTSILAFNTKKESQKDKPSTIGALVNGKLTFTKEKVLGNILKGALENMHFVKKEINDDLSEDAFKLFIERIDYGKQFLMKSDIRDLSKYEEEFDDELKTGNLVIAHKASDILKARIKIVEAHVTKTLAKPFNFNEKESFQTDAKKREFVRTVSQLKNRWTKMLKLDALSEYLDLKDERDGKNQKKDKKKNKKLAKDKKSKKDNKKLTDKEIEVKAREKVVKRYQKVFKRLKDEKANDRLDKFYNSITRVYDPHTHYLIPAEKEDFDIEMSGKLEGIGALLREENSYIKVERIIPGSASWKGKELKAEDVILAVGQADEDTVDVVDMSLRDAVKLIRGKKGTTVKLTVKRPDGTKKIIPIVRDEVIIEESYVKSSVIENKKLGVKVGYIVVPKFYRDFDDANGRNCSNDVRVELEKLKKSNIQAVILDLRNNGGGALEDARLMSGLFIKKGPIVQVKAHTGAKEVLTDVDGKVYFKKPVIVLVNRFSASASEIVAAALQDYGRAIIVGSGEQTHGKGTVQAVVGLDRYAGPMGRTYAPLGALKITIQMFYRINGGSTQFKGVVPDIKLPDPFAYMESGERSLDYAIPYGEIGKVDYKKWKNNKYNLKDIVRSSNKRVKKSKAFNQITESVSWYKERRDKSERTLNVKQMAQFRDEAFKKSEEFKNSVINKDIKISMLKKTRDTVDKEAQTEFKESLQKDPVIDEVLHIFKDVLKSK
jgi:carboxyl-terminal processing protease